MMSGSLSSKALLDANRWTPDSVIVDLDGCFVHQHQQPYEFDTDRSFYSKNGTIDENDEDDDDNEDVFDRQSVFDYYSSVFHRNGSSRNNEDDDEMHHNFYEEDSQFDSIHQHKSFTTLQKDLDVWHGEATVTAKSAVGDKRLRELDGGNYSNNYQNS